MALMLIKDGHTLEEAISMIRAGRGEDALFNHSFCTWLLSEGATFFQSSPSQQAA
jgi:hypothetical protein